MNLGPPLLVLSNGGTIKHVHPRRITPCLRLIRLTWAPGSAGLLCVLPEKAMHPSFLLLLLKRQIQHSRYSVSQVGASLAIRPLVDIRLGTQSYVVLTLTGRMIDVVPDRTLTFILEFAVRLLLLSSRMSPLTFRQTSKRRSTVPSRHSSHLRQFLHRLSVTGRMARPSELAACAICPGDQVQNLSLKKSAYLDPQALTGNTQPRIVSVRARCEA